MGSKYQQFRMEQGIGGRGTRDPPADAVPAAEASLN